METFDITEKLHLDFRASCIANDENPDYHGRLIDIITEDHIKQALREYFEECPEWGENLMPYALKMYYETEKIEQHVKGMIDNFMSALVPHYDGF